jgi:hypothetical protein
MKTIDDLGPVRVSGACTGLAVAGGLDLARDF